MSGPSTRRDAASYLAGPEPEIPPISAAGAAVLLTLRDGAQGVEALLIVRSERDSDPASGQVGLPGGRVDPDDASLLATAVREAYEEVGLTPAMLAAPPRFVRIAPAPRFGLAVAIFAARLAANTSPPLRLDPEEVAGTRWFEVRGLETIGSARVRAARGEIEVDAVPLDGAVLWGFTLRVLRDFFTGSSSTGATAPSPPDGPRRGSNAL